MAKRFIGFNVHWVGKTGNMYGEGVYPTRKEAEELTRTSKRNSRGGSWVIEEYYIFEEDLPPM